MSLFSYQGSLSCLATAFILYLTHLFLSTTFFKFFQLFLRFSLQTRVCGGVSLNAQLLYKTSKEMSIPFFNFFQSFFISKFFQLFLRFSLQTRVCGGVSLNAQLLYKTSKEMSIPFFNFFQSFFISRHLVVLCGFLSICGIFPFSLKIPSTGSRRNF